MELMMAKKLEEMSFEELIEILQELQQEDRDAFNVLRELVENHI